MAEVTAELLKQLRERTGVGMGKCKEALTEAKGDIELAIANLRKAGIASAVKKESRETNEGVIAIAENNQYLSLVEINAETDFVVKNEKFQQFAHMIAEEVCRHAPASVEALLKLSCSKDPKLTLDEVRAITIQSLGENIQVKRLKLIAKKPNASLAVYSHSGGKLVTLVEIEGAGSYQDLAKDIAMHVAAESPEYLNTDQIPHDVLEREKDIARAQVKDKPAAIIDKIVEGKLKAFYAQACLIYQPFIKDTSVSVGDLVQNTGKAKGENLKLSYFLRWKVGE
ncbi:MAG: elongation factor Ts [Verrucomicrobia bacterium]|nr:elongation factor Ts [Verrucomicrobiota bacterium]MBS0645657.1 elongation factor Ts [Verrucomicrobiota bacterium]